MSLLAISSKTCLLTSQVGRILKYDGSKFMRNNIPSAVRWLSSNDCGSCEAPSKPCPPPPPPCSDENDKAPPCPEKPPCPSRLCPENPDPGNPCNYVPPPCPDDDRPDLSRIKKIQCKFQCSEDPVYLMAGKRDAILYQIVLLLTLFGLISNGYGFYKLLTK